MTAIILSRRARRLADETGPGVLSFTDMVRSVLESRMAGQTDFRPPPQLADLDHPRLIDGWLPQMDEVRL
jgi:hypothetical protein